jgi:hypothetical protein
MTLVQHWPVAMIEAFLDAPAPDAATSPNR